MAAKGSGAVHPLTRLSSQGDYVVVDRQAAQVLGTETARRIEQAQSPYGVFYELYLTTKRKAKSLLSRRAVGVSPALSRNQLDQSRSRSNPATVDPYDTSDWEDASSPKSEEDLIDARNVALEFQGILSIHYPGGNKFELRKFRIVQLDDKEDDPSRDYFLKIEIDTPRTDCIFVQIHAGTDEDRGIPHLTLVPGYLRPPPLS